MEKATGASQLSDARMKIRPPDPPPSDAPTNEEFDRRWTEIVEDELRQILYWKWDPIGVSGYFPDCKDEYDSYGREIISILRSGATVDDVADRLLHFQGVVMAGVAPLGGAQTRRAAPRRFGPSLSARRRTGLTRSRRPGPA
jgi:hypothetical protein